MIKVVRLVLLFCIVYPVLAQDSVDVTFYYYPTDSPSSVHIPGEFNGWNSSSSESQMSYDGSNHRWWKTIRLRVNGPNPLPTASSVPGAYQYKIHDGDWFADPLNPLNNSSDNGNSYLFINDPTIHLLLPNSTPASGVVRSRNPKISAYLFPSTSTEIDTASIVVTIDNASYTNIGGSYDPITNQVSFIVPDALGDGEHSLSISAKTVGGTSTSHVATSFTVQANLVQLFTLPAQTWKNTWRIQGAVFNTAGEYDQTITNAELHQGDSVWIVSVNGGQIDTALSLLEGDNIFQLQLASENSSLLTIHRLIEHAPTAKIQIIDVGSQMLFSADGSFDPDGGVLNLLWNENPDNPTSLGLAGSSDQQVNITPPVIPGEYYVSLRVIDANGDTDSTKNYFRVEADGTTINVGGYEDNPQWVKDSRIYLLFFKAFTPEGTISAAIPKLDYIEAMGFNTIWVLPVMEIPGDVDNQINIGYYIEDFMKIESSYGTASDYKRFVDTAHELGLKVIQDVTPNHSGRVHAFAEEAKLYGSFSQYWDYYQTEYIPHNDNGLGDCVTPEGIRYYCGFSDALLNWDWRDLDARNYMIDVYEYWLNEFGIDGYRFDVYWGPSRKFGEANMGVPVREALKRIKPDIMLLGEDDGTGSGTEYIYADQGGGLDVGYDFKSYFNAIRSFGFTASSINTLHAELDNGAYYPGENSYYLRFMESQDEDRIAYKYNSFVKTMPMASVVLTAPGIPMVLNGQEVGWGKGMGAPGEPDLNDRRRGIIDWDFDGKSLLTPHYQKLAQIRSQFAAFSQHRIDTNSDGNVNTGDDSDFIRVATGNDIMYAFLRPYPGSNGLTVVNFSSTEQATTLDLGSVNLQFEGGFNITSSYWVNNHYAGASEFLTGTELQTYSVTLPAYGTAIFTISELEEMVHIPSIPGYVNTVDDPSALPGKIRLYQNYPNPFNPATTIRFDLPEAMDINLSVFNIIGQEVWSVSGGVSHYSAGSHDLTWNGTDIQGNALPAGVYFVELQTPGFRQVQKIMLLK